MNAAPFQVGRAGLASVLIALTTIAGGGPLFASPPEIASQRVEAGPILLEQELDRTSMLAAERMTVTWRMLAPLDVRVTLPPPPEPGAKAGDFTVVSCMDDPPRVAGDRLVLARRLVLEPFLPGVYSVPAIEAEWSRPGNERGVARTSPARVEVVSLLESSATDPAKGGSTSSEALDPGPIRGEHVASTRGGESWLLPTGALLVMAVIGGVVMVATRRRRITAADPVAVALALANAAGINPGDPSSDPRALDDLSRSLRTALADRVTDLATTMAGLESEAASPGLPSDRSVLLRDARPLLTTLDERRFSGQPLTTEELDTLRRQVVELLTRLHSLPRGRGGEAP